MLTSLATDVADPLSRLDAVISSTQAAKRQLSGMTQSEILAYTALLMAPATLQVATAALGLRLPGPHSFNVCVSNVPGSHEPLFFRGGRLEASYPVSIPAHGMALNITLHGYADSLGFGFVADRDAVPHLQRLAVQTRTELETLQKALQELG